MPLVVVACAEQAHAERLVKKQKAAEIRRDRLDADSNTVEIVTRRHVAQMFVEEQFLHTGKIVVAIDAVRGIDVDGAHFLGGRAVEVEHRHEAELVIGRPERRVALDQRQVDDGRLDKSRLAPVAKRAVRSRRTR